MYLCTSLEENRLGVHAKFQVHRCFDMDLVCMCNVLSGHKRVWVGNVISLSRTVYTHSTRFFKHIRQGG